MERSQGRPPPSTHPNPIDVNGGGDASRSPESWAAGSPPTRPAVCSAPVCLSHHGFVQLLQHLKRYVWGRITSQGISGWPGQGLSAHVSTPAPARERRGPIGRARGSQASGVPKVGGRCIVRSSCSFGTHMASPFSFLGRQCCFRGRAAGVRGRWERVLCWDEALYPHIFLWERESGSSVALPPSVASSAHGLSAFCLLSVVTGFGLRFGGLGLRPGLGLGLTLGVALALALGLRLGLP